MAKTTIKTLLRAAMGSKSIRYIGPDKPRRLKRSLTNIGTNFKPIMASGSTSYGQYGHGHSRFYYNSKGSVIRDGPIK